MQRHATVTSAIFGNIPGAGKRHGLELIALKASVRFREAMKSSFSRTKTTDLIVSILNLVFCNHLFS